MMMMATVSRIRLMVGTECRVTEWTFGIYPQFSQCDQFLPAPTSTGPPGARTFEFGFGYGATWGSIILIFASVVLLICDRESEEIFYKERQVEEEEEEESGEA